jgi:hypothetical protein
MNKIAKELLEWISVFLAWIFALVVLSVLHVDACTCEQGPNIRQGIKEIKSTLFSNQKTYKQIEKKESH